MGGSDDAGGWAEVERKEGGMAGEEVWEAPKAVEMASGMEWA